MFLMQREKFFPLHFNPDIRLAAVSAAEFWKEANQIADQTFTPFAQLGLYESPLERQNQARHLLELRHALPHEYFLFRHRQERVIGWSFGYLRGQADFFMSWSGVLPAFQRQGIYSAFLNQLLPFLKEVGYQRVVSKHMVNNNPVLIAKLKAGFIFTGFSMDEQLGAQLHLTYYFYPDQEDGFERAFSLDNFNKR